MRPGGLQRQREDEPTRGTGENLEPGDRGSPETCQSHPKMGAAQQRDQRVQLRAHPADRQQQPCRSAAMPRARHDLLDLRTERERHRRPQKRAGRVAQPVESAAIATRVEDLKHFDRGGQRRAKQHSKNQRHRRTRATHDREEGRHPRRYENRDL